MSYSEIIAEVVISWQKLCWRKWFIIPLHRGVQRHHRRRRGCL